MEKNVPKKSSIDDGGDSSYKTPTKNLSTIVPQAFPSSEEHIPPKFVVNTIAYVRSSIDDSQYLSDEMEL